MLLAAHYAGVGQQTGTGVGAVHAIGPRDRHPRADRPRTALATVMPEVFETYLGVRDGSWRSSRLRSAQPTHARRPAEAARAGIDAVRSLLERWASGGA
jgi:hypothetical protein